MNGGGLARAEPRSLASATLLAALLPALLVNLAVFVVPTANLVQMSFRAASSAGALGETFSLATWTALASDAYYLDILVRTVWVGLLTTVLALVLAYPLALFTSRQEGRWRNYLVLACISPLLISAVVRTYGWMILLGNQGLLPAAIRGLGFVPPRLINNEVGVIVGLTQILLPYMFLSIYSGLGRLDRTLEDAAQTLGAPAATVFRRIVLPLSLPGVLLGCLLCFVLAVSSFITPKMLAGGRVSLLATEIYDQAITTLNWPLAACLSILILIVFGTALVVYGRLVRALD